MIALLQSVVQFLQFCTFEESQWGRQSDNVTDKQGAGSGLTGRERCLMCSPRSAPSVGARRRTVWWTRWPWWGSRRRSSWVRAQLEVISCWSLMQGFLSNKEDRKGLDESLEAEMGEMEVAMQALSCSDTTGRERKHCKTKTSGKLSSTRSVNRDILQYVVIVIL